MDRAALRRFKLPSASEIARAFACPSSFLAPRISQAASVYAKKGTTLHAYIRNVLGGMERTEALALIPEEDDGRAACEELDIDVLPRGGRLELAMAWNPETGAARELGEDIDRAYEAHGADRLEEYVGSADFVGVMQGERVIVLDWKSGFFLCAARDSWQLRILAVMAAAIYGAKEAVVGHLIIRDERPRWDLATIDMMGLAGHRAALVELAGQLRTARPLESLDAGDVTEGEHCRYCPSFKRCPAKVGLVRQMALTLADGKWSEQIDPARAAERWLTLDRFDEVAKRMRGEICSLAEHMPIALGDGRELRMAPGDAEDKILDPADALGFIAEQLGQEVARAAATTSKGAIEEAVRLWAKANGAKIGASKKMVIDELRKRGTIRKVRGEIKVRVVDVGAP